MKDYLIKKQQKYYGQTIENTKVLVHRGKKELRKILIKKGFDSMNKLVKILLIVISATILLTGLTYAGRKMYEKAKKIVDKSENKYVYSDLAKAMKSLYTFCCVNNLKVFEK